MKKFTFLAGLFLFSFMGLASATPTLGAGFAVLLILFYVFLPLLPFFILSLIGSRYFYKSKKQLSTAMQVLKWGCYMVFILTSVILGLALVVMAGGVFWWGL